MNRAITAVAFSTLLLACGKQENPVVATSTPAHPTIPLPREAEAKDLLAASNELADYQFTYASWSIPLDRAAQNEATKKTAQELRAAGWIGLDGDGNVVLSDKARNDHRFLVRPNRTLDIVPLAKKEVVAVQSVQPKPDGDAIVEFEWKWIPNEIGSVLKSGLIQQQYATFHHARATLMQSEGKWAVEMIEEANAKR